MHIRRGLAVLPEDESACRPERRLPKRDPRITRRMQLTVKALSVPAHLADHTVRALLHRTRLLLRRTR